MNVAIISITQQGKDISDKITQKLQQDPQIIHIKQYHKNVKDAIAESFNTYDAIIAIMASRQYSFTLYALSLITLFPPAIHQQKNII